MAAVAGGGGGGGARCGISERTSGNDAALASPAAAATLNDAVEISDANDPGANVGVGSETSIHGSDSGGRTATPCAERGGVLLVAMRKSGIALTRSSDKKYNRRDYDGQRDRRTASTGVLGHD
jgi:hypothetical protein